ncbi:hypothetical protein Tco_0477289 [Tanacetum coccineum]
MIRLPLRSPSKEVMSDFYMFGTRVKNEVLAKACWHAFLADTYAALVVEMAKEVYFLENHDSVIYQAHGVLMIKDEGLKTIKNLFELEYMVRFFEVAKAGRKIRCICACTSQETMKKQSPIRRRANCIVLIEEDMTGVMTKLILRERMEKALAESNLAKPKTEDDMNIELSKQFLMELRSNAYYGMFDEDVVDHIAKVLEILDLIKTPNMDTDCLRIMVFPLSLADYARQ